MFYHFASLATISVALRCCLKYSAATDAVLIFKQKFSENCATRVTLISSKILSYCLQMLNSRSEDKRDCDKVLVLTNKLKVFLTCQIYFSTGRGREGRLASCALYVYII